MASRKTSSSARDSAPRTVEYATPALDKGIDILELLATQPDGLTKSQIARELGRSVSEILRMLVCLERRNYIANLSGERYSLTLKMFQMVQQHPPTQRLLLDAMPAMQRLTDETLQSCHLGVLERSHVVILAQQNAPSNLGFYVKVGSTVDLLQSASGYVILAHQSEQQRARMLANWEAATGERAPKDLESSLRRIARTGYEKSASFLVRGVMNMSFPILDHQNAAVAALTIPFIQYSKPAVTMEQTLGRLRQAAAEITASVGGAITKGR